MISHYICTRKASKLFVCFHLQMFSPCIVFNNWSWKQTNVSFEAFLTKELVYIYPNQINFLFVANVVFQCYHFSKQFLSHLSKITYIFGFFHNILLCCNYVSLAKMVTLTNNIVYKKSAQHRKYIWSKLKNANFTKLALFFFVADNKGYKRNKGLESDHIHTYYGL